MINLQLHGSGSLLMRKVAPASRLAPASIGGMHTNLLVPSPLKINKMVGTSQIPPDVDLNLPHLNVTLTKAPEFPTNNANCKD